MNELSAAKPAPTAAASPEEPTEIRAGEPLRHTSLHASHVERKARLVGFAGWEMPIQYTGIVDEHTAVRTAAGLFDVSHMGELEMTGEYAGQVVNHLVTNDIARLEDGQAAYTCCCNAEGTVEDDLIVYRCAAERFLIVCNASNRERMAKVFSRAAENHCEFKDRSDETALIALQGPKAFEVLALVGGDGPSLHTLKGFHFRDAVVANVKATVARTGYTGEDGVEIFCAWTEAPQVWRTLLSVGEPFGIKPVGLGARDTLRLEACLSLYGNEIDQTTNPLEAGLARWVKLDAAKGDFVGRAAIERAKVDGPSRVLVGFEMVGRGVARHGYPLHDASGAKVGVCTSGGPAPTVGKSIGLGYVPVSLSAVGTRFFVDCRGKQVEAVVVPKPFYKRPARTPAAT